jgi:hypothetical protein
MAEARSPAGADPRGSGCRPGSSRDRTICLNETVAGFDQGIWGIFVKRFAVFAIAGPPISAAVLFLVLLPMAGVLEGVPVVISTPVLPAYSYAVLAALVVALFDWVASLIEVPFRPIAAAIVGWVLAFALLRGYLALPDLPGWFAAIGLLGAVPGFVCSWVTMRMDGKEAKA